MRLYSAICEFIEVHAARVRTDTLDAEMENVDWAKSGGWVDDETN